VDNRKKEYLDKIVTYLFEDTDFEYVPNDKLCRVVVDTYFTTDCFTEWTYHNHTLIQDFCVQDYGLSEDEVRYVWREYNKMIFDKVREIININRNLNESVSDKENMVIDKIVNFMLEDTKYKIKTIKGDPVARIVYPFYNDEVYTEDWDGCDYHLNYMDEYPLNDEEVNYISNQYGITDTTIILEIFNRYIRILFTKLLSEIEDKMGDDSLNESVDKYYSVSKLLNPPYFRDLISLEIPQKEWDDIFKHIFKNKDIYVLYIGSKDSDLDAGVIVDRDSKTFIYREMGNGDYRFGISYDVDLNESIETNNRFLDKVVESLINDTKINTKLATILYPPINFHSSHMSLLLPSGAFYNEFADYCNKHYGITPEEFDIVWRKYSKIMFDKFDESDNVLKESDDRRKNYLDKVLEFIVNDTQIDPHPVWPSNWINILVPFTNLVYSRIMHFDREDFFDYCRDTYGLTKDESYSMWEDYINEVNQILINEWGISDPIYH
jgi:hypothetical protein